MEEKIIWKLVYWDMKMLKDGWWGKPVYVVKLKYGTYRNNEAQQKYEEKKFKTLESTFDYLKESIEIAEKVNL